MRTRVAPPDDSLEACVMNRLQEMERGQTIEQLQQHCKRMQVEILVVLEVYRKEGYVRYDNGVWIMVRGSGKTQS